MDLYGSFQDLIGESLGDIGWREMAVRALVVFAYGIAITRIGGWRAFGKWSPPDIIIAIVVGSNLSRALTGPAPLLPTLLATTVLFAAYWAVSFCASRSDLLDRLFKGRASLLIVEGKVDADALRRALISPRDLQEGLRGKGVESAGAVAAAYVERSGKISVVRNGPS